VQVGSPVALATNSAWTGTITGVRGDRADVDFDGGGTGKGIEMSDLREQDDPRDEREVEQDEPATDEKAWPPKGIQTKVPQPDGQK
jgi:hypothetical protein